jgi:hypothetical protein
MFLYSPDGSTNLVSIRDVVFTSLHTTGGVWFSAGSTEGSWIIENCAINRASVSPAVMDLGSGSVGQTFVLVNVCHANPPTAGLLAGTGVPVEAIGYTNVTAGYSTSAVRYPFYAVNAGTLWQQGTFSARPSASTYGETFY